VTALANDAFDSGIYVRVAPVSIKSDKTISDAFEYGARALFHLFGGFAQFVFTLQGFSIQAGYFQTGTNSGQQFACADWL
jgi:hypothetical protein